MLFHFYSQTDYYCTQLVRNTSTSFNSVDKIHHSFRNANGTRLVETCLPFVLFDVNIDENQFSVFIYVVIIGAITFYNVCGCAVIRSYEAAI